MKPLSRDAKLGIGIFALLLIVTIFAATQQQSEERHPRLSTLSSAPDGALALKLWMDALDYPVHDQTLANFAPPEEASILFMLEPLFPTEGEMKAIDEWVQEDGGTLILIGDRYGAFSAVDHYDFAFDYQPQDQNVPKIEAPILLSPPEFNPGDANTRIVLESERDDFVVLMTNQGHPVLVSFDLGEGRVILGTISDIFTNAGLKRPGNPELALNVLALAKNKGPVWFDEWHHGVQSGGQILGPSEFLRRTPIGRALLFIVFAVLVVF
ncbi:MAG: DUF4350 domain-containing protein, partial [Anaerolineales bacterium]|nr:DUF4350 domain-containing protein [Anaerolineales bacterium]